MDRREVWFRLSPFSSEDRVQGSILSSPAFSRAQNFGTDNSLMLSSPNRVRTQARCHVAFGVPRDFGPHPLSAAALHR